jgi:tRNA-dihydrouridine synthase A
VTVKCRIGIDDQGPEEALDRLADAVVAAGADALVVHARKAWLKGLSPKENREIPPLDYGRVHRLKARLPQVPVAINGGIGSLAEVLAQLARVDGVMLGRAAYQSPEILLGVDPQLFGEPAPAASAEEAVEAMIPYAERHLTGGGRLSEVTRHMLGLFAGRPGARAFRRVLATGAVKPGAGIEVLRAALAEVSTAGRHGATAAPHRPSADAARAPEAAIAAS